MPIKEIVDTAEALDKVPFGVYLFLSSLVFLSIALGLIVYVLLKSKWTQVVNNVKQIREDLDSLVRTMAELSKIVAQNSSIRAELNSLRDEFLRADSSYKGEINHIRARTRSLEAGHIQVKSILLSKGVMSRESDIDLDQRFDPLNEGGNSNAT